MDNNQASKVDTALKTLKTAMESKGAQVRSAFDREGRFKVVVSRDSRTVVLAHGFNLHDDEIQKSATVDVLFRDESMSPTEYVLVMTEGEVEDYPWNIQEAQRLMSAFFDGQFEKRVVKKFFFFKNEDLWFTTDNLKYVDAVAVR